MLYRYQSFSNAAELQKEMISKRPVKIDIGAVFNARPSDHKKVANFQPQVIISTFFYFRFVKFQLLN